MNELDPVTAPKMVARDIEYKNMLIIIDMQNPISLVFRSNSGQQLSFPANLFATYSLALFPKKSSIYYYLLNLIFEKIKKNYTK